MRRIRVYELARDGRRPLDAVMNACHALGLQVRDGHLTSLSEQDAELVRKHLESTPEPHAHPQAPRGQLQHTTASIVAQPAPAVEPPPRASKSAEGEIQAPTASDASSRTEQVNEAHTILPTRRVIQRMRDHIAATFRGGEILRFLDANHLRIEGGERIEGSHDDYHGYLLAPRNLRDEFGFTAEQILLTRLHSTKQNRQSLVAEIRQQLRQNNRLTKSAVLVVSEDHDIRRLCSTTHLDPDSGYKTAHVAFRGLDISNTTQTSSNKSLLRQELTHQAFCIDHFDTRIPVPEDLFGRGKLVRQIEVDISTSGDGIAILGIRRVGKTSVLKHVLKQLTQNEEGTWCIGYYDAQVDSIAATSGTAFAGIDTALRADARQRGIELPGVPRGLSPKDQLVQSVQHILQRDGRRVVIAVDEVEWLIPTPGIPDQEERGREYLKTFSVLRSLKQRFGSQFAVVVCGINEAFCEFSRVNGHPNPGLDWYKTFYVEPLAGDEARDMLRTLGARMGLTIDDGFMNGCLERFGGHAYLLRQFCSHASTAITDRPGRLRESTLEELYDDFGARAEAIYRDITTHLDQFYPDEYRFLVRIALDGDGGVEDGRMARHLKRYGIVTRRPDGRLAIPQRSLIDLLSHSGKIANKIELLEKLGHGGYADVWRATRSGSGQQFALKIYSGANARENAELEFGILEFIAETPAARFAPRVIEVLEYANQPALAMELVDGVSLSDLLQRAGVLSFEALVAFSDNLFAALEAIHSPTGRIEVLAKKDEMSRLDFAEYSRLHAQGILHRDLKPSNIMIADTTTMALKLIDFGISKREQEAAQTRVGTPDYLPPDWGTSQWNPTFDLYAAALVLWRCAVGEICESVKRTEVLAKRVGDPALAPAAVAFFEKGLASTSTDRFQTAHEMRDAWSEALIALA